MRIGIDLGGTKTEGIVMDTAGNIVLRKRRPTPQIQGYRAILDNIKDLVDALEKQAGCQCTIGIGTPGAMSTVTGALKNSNTTCMNGKPLKQDLEALLARPVRIENDANCFVLSEALDGAGREYSVVFGVIIGTGVGGGIVVNKQLLTGSQHIAGEWGHNTVAANGPACYCGKRGCVETFLSGPALQHGYRELGGDAQLTAQQIVIEAETGEAIADTALQRYLDYFGQALSVVVNILDPDAIVLGGGMSNIQRLYTEGREQLAKHVFNDELRTRLLINRHGDSAGVRGAAWLWAADEIPG